MGYTKKKKKEYFFVNSSSIYLSRILLSLCVVLVDELPLLLRHEGVQLGVVGHEDGPQETPDDRQTPVDVEDSLPPVSSGDDARSWNRDHSPQGSTWLDW